MSTLDPSWGLPEDDDLLAPPRYSKTSEEADTPDETLKAARGEARRCEVGSGETGGFEPGDVEVALPVIGAPEAEPSDDERPERTYASPSRLVVMTTSEGRLARISIATDWALRSEDPLDHAIAICLRAYHLDHPEPPLEPLSETIETSERLTKESLQRVADELERLRAEMAEMPVVDPWKGEGTSASDFDDGVTVSLDRHGRLWQIRFDPEWLNDRPSHTDLERGIMTAYRKARNAWTPPEPVYSDYDRAAARREALADSLMTMMANGVGDRDLLS